jgi:hypothetical protein
LTVAFWLS